MYEVYCIYSLLLFVTVSFFSADVQPKLDLIGLLTAELLIYLRLWIHLNSNDARFDYMQVSFFAGKLIRKVCWWRFHSRWIKKQYWGYTVLNTSMSYCTAMVNIHGSLFPKNQCLEIMVTGFWQCLEISFNILLVCINSTCHVLHYFTCITIFSSSLHLQIHSSLCSVCAVTFRYCQNGQVLVYCKNFFITKYQHHSRFNWYEVPVESSFNVVLKQVVCRNLKNYLGFYRAMHFSAKRGIAIACRLSVRLSVTLMNCDHIGWNSSKIISPLVSLGRSLFATPTWRVCSKGNTP